MKKTNKHGILLLLVVIFLVSLFSTIYMKKEGFKCKNKKTNESCVLSGCKWRHNKCNK